MFSKYFFYDFKKILKNYNFYLKKKTSHHLPNTHLLIALSIVKKGEGPHMPC